MIHPAPTSRIDPTVARGTLVEVIAPTPTRPGVASITFPNSSYQFHLIPSGPITTEPGKRILGRIRAKVRRVDKVGTGGRYVEPVIGRPRRIQGAVLATNEGARTITVDASVPIECTLTDDRQKPGQFAVGDFVSFDVLDGATFTPES